MPMRRKVWQFCRPLVGVSVLLPLLGTPAASAEAPADIAGMSAAIYRVGHAESTAQAPGLSHMSVRTLEIVLANGLRLAGVFADDPNTPGVPDYLQIIRYGRAGETWRADEVFADAGVDGIEPPAASDMSPTSLDGYSSRAGGGKVPRSVLLETMTRVDLAKVIARYLSALTELYCYAGDPSGKVPPPRSGDDGALLLEETPVPGLVHWVERLPGLQTTAMDVLFRGKLVDRVHLVRVDPDRYIIGVHNDLALRSIEQWRQDLDALVVVNGSYFRSDPYGEPMTPTQNEGRRLDKTHGYRSTNGALLAEPLDPKKPRAAVMSFPDEVSADDLIAREGYQTVVFSYPLLLDEGGRNNAIDSLRKRATRTFVAQDRDGQILLGNTEGGFFSLKRLGNFLRKAGNLNLAVALNMDGGPPACMAVRAGGFEYVNYGQWESVVDRDEEVVVWNDGNTGRWEIPIVISVTARP